MSASAAPHSNSLRNDVRRAGILKTSLPPKHSVSSEEEYDSPSSQTANFHQTQGRPQTYRTTPSNDHEVTANDSWLDFPLAFALLPAAGSILTGSDLLKDFMLMSLLIYYLHTLIKVPWELYSLARARRAPSDGAVESGVSLRDQDHQDFREDRIRELARSELRLAELVYLSFTLVAPFLGAVLLRYVSQLLSIDIVSTFSTSVFVLATGIRPWRHLVNLLRHRTESLQNVVHLPNDASLIRRVDRLEANFRQQQEARPDMTSVNADIRRVVDEALERLAMREQKTDAEKRSLETRLVSLESALADLKASSTRPVTSIGRHVANTHHIQVGLGGTNRSRHYTVNEPTTLIITLPLPSLVVPQIQRVFEWVTTKFPVGQTSPSRRPKWRKNSNDTSVANWPGLDSTAGASNDSDINDGKYSSASVGYDLVGVDEATKNPPDSRLYPSVFVHVLLWPIRLMRKCAEWVAGIVFRGIR